ncbi:MAG: PilZ domain-containing protein [Treponemataceae bacterium]|nr:PilZ domain-containing protein [Treponemataceae bacterium]
MNSFASFPLQISASTTFLLIGVSVFLLFIVFILKTVHDKYTKGSDYSSQSAKQITNGAILYRITKMYDLDQDEYAFLKKMCTTQKIPNLEYAFHFDVPSDQFFITKFNEINGQTNKKDDLIQKELSLLFSIKQKVDNSRKTLSNLTSTAAIPVGDTISYFSDTKEQFEAKILDNTKNELILSIPKDIFGNPIRPPALSKISLLYQTKAGSAYLSDVRIIRYQNTTGAGEMVTTHCNNMQSFQKRQFKRVSMKIPCLFSAVKITTGGTGAKADIEYTPMERKYTGQLLEISAGGCSIMTNMNIREKQYIYAELNIDGEHPDSVIGLIVNTTPITDKRQFVLHILFVRITNKIRNKIFARVYEYKK